MIPNINSLYRPVLECAANGDVQLSNVVDELADTFKLTDQERNGKLGEHSEQTRFAGHVEWAQLTLQKLGLVTPTKDGHFVITDLGKAALAEPSATINKDSLFRWRESMRPEGPEGQIERIVEFLDEWEEDLRASFEAPGFDVACRSLLRNAMREIRGAAVREAPEGSILSGEPYVGETIYDENHDLVPAFFSGLSDMSGIFRYTKQEAAERGAYFGKIPAKFKKAHLVYDDGKGERLIGMAYDGNSAANLVLSYIAQAYIASGCILPQRLRDYLLEKLRKEIASRPKRRGPKPYTKEARNHLVGLTISTLQRDWGIKPTRNRASENESGCSLVQKALEKRGTHLSEPAVEKIWQDWRQRRAAPQGSDPS